MKPFSKTTILFVAALAFTLVAGGAYAFFFAAMKDKTEAATAISTSLGELSGKASRTLSAVAVLKSESARIEKLSSYFIKESEIVTFTKNVEALGPQSGTTLTIESLERGVTEKTVPFLNFRVKASGKFPDVMRLLVLLENFPGKFEWKTVRLVSDNSTGQQAGAVATKSDSTPLWNAEVFLTAFNFVKE